jgi:hypothetical protein
MDRLSPRFRAAAVLVSLAAALAPARAVAGTSPARHRSEVERRFGIRPVALRASGGGWLLDLRYRVVDAEKARAVFDAKARPVLIDRRTGGRLGVPEDEKLGALRSSPRARPEAGKQYFVLFRNPGRAIGRGAHVDVLLGRCTLRDLVVE